MNYTKAIDYERCTGLNYDIYNKIVQGRNDDQDTVKFYKYYHVRKRTAVVFEIVTIISFLPGVKTTIFRRLCFRTFHTSADLDVRNIYCPKYFSA